MPEIWTFSCATLGYVCEWRLRATSPDEIERRFRDHARCAHSLADVSADLATRVRSEIHPVRFDEEVSR